jgi:predicted dehydrogenase
MTSIKVPQWTNCQQNHEQPVKIAIAGLGRQGYEHFEACLSLASKQLVEVVAVCDSNSLTCEAIRTQFNVPSYTSYEEMAEREKYDALIIALPNALHTPVAKDALTRGIHVLKEKPFALSLEDASDLLEIAALSGCHLRVAQQRLFHPFYSKAKSWLEYLGKIRYFDYSFCLNDNTCSWYWNKELGGGCWYGLGWHGCWILNFFLSLPDSSNLQSMSGKKRSASYNTDDTALLNCTYNSGTIARLFFSVCYPIKKEEIFIEGETASLLLNRDILKLFDADGREIANDTNRYKWSLAYEQQLECFISEIKTGEVLTRDLSWETIVLHNAAWTAQTLMSIAA